MFGWLTSTSGAWFGSLFANPAFVLPAALLISVPIIIHFINRMRYRRVKWAAMEFLLASQKKNRQRLMLEQLLLLLLRILAVAAIIALIARPLLDASQFNLLRGQKTNHVILLDDTGSMQELRAAVPVFESAKKTVAKIVAEGARRPGTQTLTLIRLSQPDQPDFAVRTLDRGFEDEFNRRMETLACSHRAADWPAALAACRPTLASLKGSLLNFHVISDFRTQDWTDAKATSQALAELHSLGSNVNFVRAAPPTGGLGNVGITDLSGSVEVAAANVPLRLKVSVRNYGDQMVKGVVGSVFTDGKQVTMTIPFQRLEPGQEVSREFDVTLAEPGDHTVRVTIKPQDASQGDALAQDDERFLSIHVPDVNPVLIIAGETSSVVEDIKDALAPSPGLTGFAPQVQNPEFLRRNSLERFPAVFIVDVPQLHDEAVQRLKAFVADGGGLCWYLGPRVNAAHYNDRLYKAGFGIGPEEKSLEETFRKRDTNEDGKLTQTEFAAGANGPELQQRADAFKELDRNRDSSLTQTEFAAPRNGLFPLKLGSVATLPVDTNELPAPDIEFTEHPLFSVFTGQDNPFINTVKVSQYFATAKDWHPDEGVRVIASLRNQAPLFLEHRYGQGTVITCLTSCRDWSNWATVAPAFVVLQLEALKHVSRSRHALDRHVVGEPIRSRLDSSIYKPNVTITLPDGKTLSRDATDKTPGEKPADKPPAGAAPAGPSPAIASNAGSPASSRTSGAAVYVDEFRDTDIPGIYAITRRPLNGPEETERLTYNVPASESRLQVIGTEALRKSLGPAVPVAIQEFEAFNWLSGRQNDLELHNYVIYLLLALLVGEQLMAFRLSYHPKQKSAATTQQAQFV